MGQALGPEGPEYRIGLWDCFWMAATERGPLSAGVSERSPWLLYGLTETGLEAGTLLRGL